MRYFADFFRDAPFPGVSAILHTAKCLIGLGLRLKTADRLLYPLHLLPPLDGGYLCTNRRGFEIRSPIWRKSRTVTSGSLGKPASQWAAGPEWSIPPYYGHKWPEPVSGHDGEWLSVLRWPWSVSGTSRLEWADRCSAIGAELRRELEAFQMLWRPRCRARRTAHAASITHNVGDWTKASVSGKAGRQRSIR